MRAIAVTFLALMLSNCTAATGGAVVGGLLGFGEQHISERSKEKTRCEAKLGLIRDHMTSKALECSDEDDRCVDRVVERFNKLAELQSTCPVRDLFPLDLDRDFFGGP